MTDDELREAYARAMAEPRLGNRAECPSLDTLVALLQRRGSESARLQALDHTMACAACQQEFELLRAIDVAERRGTGAGRAVPTWRRPLVLALAASLLIAVGLGPGRDWLANRRPDPMRGDAASIVTVRPEDRATMVLDSMYFEWRAVPGATSYTVELLSLDGGIGLDMTTTGTTLLLRGPNDLLPGEYRWWVRSELAGGEVRSEPRAINLRRD